MPLPALVRPVRRLALAGLLLVAAAPRASATWSIVVVDTATGEVCVAAATCLKGVDLQNLLPVLRVGVGGAAAQSAVDLTAKNRFRIWQGFLDGTPPEDILAGLAANDTSHDQRQYGIVNMADEPAKFTGNKAGQARASVKGSKGSLVYTVQGNVLTGKTVVFKTRQNLATSSGDLAQRVMEAMEVARDLGGDGRCSCSMGDPDGCGAPPPQFDSSATVAFITLARIGDTDGVCDAISGCASGEYYLNLNVTPGQFKVDAVDELRGMFDAWRTSMAGRPDHLRSEVRPRSRALPADDHAATRVGVRLRDLDGADLSTGGAFVEVTATAGLVSVGPVVDHGNGYYSFDVRAGSATGTEELVVTVDDGQARATLYPFTELRLDPPTALHPGVDEVSASAPQDVAFRIDLGEGAAGERYLLLGSGSGTVPGTPLHGALVPLNDDPLLRFTLRRPGPPHLPHSLGELDPHGRARAWFRADDESLATLIGRRLDWAVLTSTGRVAGPVGFDVIP